MCYVHKRSPLTQEEFERLEQLRQAEEQRNVYTNRAFSNYYYRRKAEPGDGAHLRGARDIKPESPESVG